VTVGSIIDDLRLPPDPKVGGSRVAHMPDLTVEELRQLRQLLGDFLYWSTPSSSAPMATRSTFVTAVRANAPLLKKFLGEAT
jgi:hypothetical protein